MLRTFCTKYDIIKETNSGTVIDKQTERNIKNALLDFLYMVDTQAGLYKEMCVNARKTAEDYDFSRLTAKLIVIIEGT